MRTVYRIITEWGERAFGAEHMSDPRMRALRLAEEAVELAQAVGLPEDKLSDLVRIVYSRPPGDAFQELGGVQVCAVAQAAAMGVDLDDVLAAEVCRVLTKSPEHFAARNREKLDLGLTGAAPDQDRGPVGR